MRPSVLIVEDEESLAQSMAEYFDHHGYAVDVALELEKAEALIAAGSYQAVITDLRLTSFGREEGLEVVSLTRIHLPRAHVVVLTAFPTPENESTAYALGACMLLTKPQPLAEVESRVRALLPEEYSPSTAGSEAAVGGAIQRK
jgi:DNA-binding response OmpR family regulator